MDGRWKPKVNSQKDKVEGRWKPKVNSQKDMVKLSGHLKGQVEVKGLTHKEPNPYLRSEVIRVDV